MSPAMAFVYGFIGAFLLNLVRLAELAQIPKLDRPATFSDGLWIFQFLALPFVGGVLAWIYQNDGVELRPLIAMNLGLSAPLMLKAMAAAAPQDLPTNTD